MDKSISSSCNNDDGVPEETGMDKVLSDLNALKKLYGLLQRLDETSRALLKKLLDDATRKALLKQANALVTASDSVIPFSLGLTSAKKMDQAASSSSSFLNNNKETEMEQILSDLQALTRLYMLLHKGPVDEDLDEASRVLLMKILEDATQEAVRRQAKMLSASLVSPALERKLSMRSDCQTQHADPRLRPVPVSSPRPSLLARERSRRLNLQHSTVSRRSSLHVDGHRHAAEEEPPLARFASKCSSRTALPARPRRPSQEQRQYSSLSLHRRFHVAGTSSQHGTVTRGTTRLADFRDSFRRSSAGRGDQWSLERSSSSSSGRSVSRELSLGPSSRLRGRTTTTPRHVGTESSSSSARLFQRLDSGLSVSTTSRHGVGHARRGVATPERSSSSNTVATIQSRIRPSNRLLEGRRTSRSRGRRRHVSDVSGADKYSDTTSSGSRSSSGAGASMSASTSPTTSPAPPAPRAFANPYYYSPPVTAAQRGIAPPVTAARGIAAPPMYAPEASRSMRRRRRQEVLEKRVARLRMLKEKIATVFHHRHDHHHHHHIGGGGGGQEAGPSSRSVVRGAGHHLNSPWQYLTSMFHHAKKGKDKNTRSRAVAGVPEKKRRGGGGKNMHALFDAVRQHLKKGKRRAPPAGIKLRRKASRSRVRAKKMHWLQRLRQRRGMAGVTAGSRPRGRLGHGKAGWL